MRHLSVISTFFLFLFVTPTARAQAYVDEHGTRWEVRLGQTDYDFGKISRKNPIKAVVFEFRNLSDRPIAIQHAKPSCQCTSVRYSKKPVLPGKKGYITVRYDASGSSTGRFQKYVGVNINGEPRFFRLTVKGEVTPSDK